MNTALAGGDVRFRQRTSTVTASVGIAVTDGANGPQGTNPTGTVSITVNSVNDAPAGANNTVTTSEDTNYVFTSADFGFSDTSDSPANALAAVKITTLPAAGTLLNNGIAVECRRFGFRRRRSRRATWCSSRRPTPTAPAMPASPSRSRTTAAPPMAASIPMRSANTITINVTAVNDAPTATNLTQSLVHQRGRGGNAAVQRCGSGGGGCRQRHGHGDADAGEPGGGRADRAGRRLTAAAILGDYTFTGTAAAVNTALDAVTFDSADDFNGATSVGVSDH